MIRESTFVSECAKWVVCLFLLRMDDGRYENLGIPSGAREKGSPYISWKLESQWCYRNLWPGVLGNKTGCTLCIGEKANYLSPLSIKLPLANHGCLWVHVDGRGYIALSSECVIPSCAVACAVVWKVAFGWLHMSWWKHSSFSLPCW